MDFDSKISEKVFEGLAQNLSDALVSAGAQEAVVSVAILDDKQVARSVTKSTSDSAMLMHLAFYNMLDCCKHVEDRMVDLDDEPDNPYMNIND